MVVINYKILVDLFYYNEKTYDVYSSPSHMNKYIFDYSNNNNCVIIYTIKDMIEKVKFLTDILTENYDNENKNDNKHLNEAFHFFVTHINYYQINKEKYNINNNTPFIELSLLSN